MPFYTNYTDFLARFAGDIAGARGVWDALVKTDKGKDCAAWTAFIEWEATFGELVPVRSTSDAWLWQVVSPRSSWRLGTAMYNVQIMYTVELASSGGWPRAVRGQNTNQK